MLYVMKKYCLPVIILLVWGCKKDDYTPVVNKKSQVAVNEFTADPELVVYNVKGIARVTGKTLPWDSYHNPNETDVKYNVGGTDLGIMWDLGGGHTGIFFGDTFGRDWQYTAAGGGNGSNWRSNVAAYSADNNLDDGLSFKGMLTGPDGTAKQIIPLSGAGTITTIPTAAIRIAGTDYVHYMAVKQWGEPGKWTTNFSALYRSADNGQTWSAAPGVQFGSNSSFAQAAFAKKDGYVYMMGTPSGRFGNAYLARFLYADVLNQAEYEYWVEGTGWVKNSEQQASKIIEAPVGELSLAYNTHFNRWIVTYLDVNKLNIVFRDAAEITGPWSKPKNLVTWAQAPGLYGAFIHPQKTNSEELYFLMSVWQPYNVFLVRARLRLQQ